MKYSFIVSVEHYCDSKISRVIYAENDAIEFAQAIENIGYMNTESMVFINTSATKTMIEAKLKQLSRLVTKDDQIIFYYAGHGFAENVHNYITCYDTLSEDGVSTSIQIQLIFDLLKNSCNNVLFFFDSCHSGSTIDNKMRSMITSMKSLLNR